MHLITQRQANEAKLIKLGETNPRHGRRFSIQLSTTDGSTQKIDKNIRDLNKICDSLDVTDTNRPTPHTVYKN